MVCNIRLTHPDTDYGDKLEEMFDVEIDDEDELEKEAERFIGQQIFQYLFMNAKVSESLDYLDSLHGHTAGTRVQKFKSDGLLIFK
ncbi:hypothetical protein [Jeotgalicoccus sp. WY2]|uniref:hypothetical protein n=1 Tax=Jeotgalicoccus sp. WY2 TaxID=2708346 RepID=UPI001BD67458|nr:hypothetical protein [Jeotgalicoccus sp. WY2]